MASPASSTNPPSAASPADRVALPAGVELAGEFVGSGYREAPRLVYRGDGQVVRLPGLLYLVVQVLDRRRRAGQPYGAGTVSQIAASVSRAIGREITSDQIAYVCDRKLAPLGVTTYSDGAPPDVDKPAPFLALRLRTAVLPAALTWHIAGAFRWLYRPPVMLATLMVAAVAEVWVLATQHIAAALAHTLASPAGIVALVALALASTAFHEAGHAAACRYGGVAPGVMGCGIYLVWPAFYTDITATYRLGRGGRLRADLGGVYFNALFVAVLVAAYIATDAQPLLAAVLATNIEVVEQLLPTLRFDGYYIMADLMGIPDLFRYVRPILARTVLRRPADQCLNELKEWPQRMVAVWVLCVVPTLLIELGYITVQLPHIVRADAASVHRLLVAALAARHPVMAMAVASLQIVLLILPALGISMIVVGVLRRLLRTIAQRLRRRQRRSGLRRRGLAVVAAGVLAAALVCIPPPDGFTHRPSPLQPEAAEPPQTSLGVNTPPSPAPSHFHPLQKPAPPQPTTRPTTRARPPASRPRRSAPRTSSPATAGATPRHATPAPHKVHRSRTTSAQTPGSDSRSTRAASQPTQLATGRTRPKPTESSRTPTPSTQPTSPASQPTTPPTTATNPHTAPWPTKPTAPSTPTQPTAPSTPTQTSPLSVPSVLALPSVLLTQIASIL